MKKSSLIWSLLLLMVVIVVAVIFWPQPFQGTWKQSGGDGEFTWYRNTTYQWHHYRAEGYPSLKESGWYWVEKHDGNIYTLKVWVAGVNGEPGRWEQQTIELTGKDQANLQGATVHR